MESLPSNHKSIFHHLLGLYTRSEDGTLSECTNDVLKEHWSEFNGLLKGNPEDKLHSQSVKLPFTLKEDKSKDALVLERWDDDRAYICGMIVDSQDKTGLEAHSEIVANLVLQSTHHTASKASGEPVKDVEQVEEKILELFSSTIRNISDDDQWDAKGKAYFQERLGHFTRRGAPIEFALPAFPCKSSNGEKVGGTEPDRAEMIALTTLHKFVKGVEEIYEPGAKVWIISDGHVFSDCIGVDDSMVDVYGTQLREMNETVGAAYNDDGKHRVCFQSLTEMFRLSDEDIEGQALAKRLGLDTIGHHIEDVKLNEDAELCRRLLMHALGADSSGLRARIDAKDPSTLALYRGFSRFMLEDLEHNDYTQDMSKSQRKKVSSKIALQMIERNQAYSNLVEMIFPYHVRLSIHAHNNGGPKFGINLMGPKVRAVNSIPPDQSDLEKSDILHVPTPWHGCIVEVSGHEHLYLTKAEQAKAAIDQKEVLGAWVAPTLPAADKNEADKEGERTPPSVAFYSVTPVAA